MQKERKVYVKVRPEVAERLRLTAYAPQTADGNYTILVSDLLSKGLCSPFGIDEYVESIGGLRLTPRQAAAEQQGRSSLPLPGDEVEEAESDPSDPSDQSDLSDQSDSASDSSDSSDTETPNPD